MVERVARRVTDVRPVTPSKAWSAISVTIYDVPAYSTFAGILRLPFMAAVPAAGEAFTYVSLDTMTSKQHSLPFAEAVQVSPAFHLVPAGRAVARMARVMNTFLMSFCYFC